MLLAPVTARPPLIVAPVDIATRPVPPLPSVVTPVTLNELSVASPLVDSVLMLLAPVTARPPLIVAPVVIATRPVPPLPSVVAPVTPKVPLTSVLPSPPDMLVAPVTVSVPPTDTLPEVSEVNFPLLILSPPPSATPVDTVTRPVPPLPSVVAPVTLNELSVASPLVDSVLILLAPVTARPPLIVAPVDIATRPLPALTVTGPVSVVAPVTPSVPPK